MPQNKTFAKQTIAHNTVVVNGASHYKGNTRLGNAHHAARYFFDASSNAHVQVVSALDSTAYNGVLLHRTSALVQLPDAKKPYVLDVFRVASANTNQYDLPWYYHGQLMAINQALQRPATLQPLGTANGYQHIWHTGTAAMADSLTRINWKDGPRFYTLTLAAQAADTLLLGRVGANDPAFNLRADPVLIARKQGAAHHAFVSVLEPAGTYSPVTERSTGTGSSIQSLVLTHNSANYTAVTITHTNGQQWRLLVANTNADKAATHRLILNGQQKQWKGPWVFYKL